MRSLAAWLRRLMALTSRQQLERDLDDELAFHLAMREAEHREAGLTASEAALAARRQFGNAAALKEQTRDAWLFSSFESWMQDVRFAARSLRRSLGFASVAVLTLALAIGVTTAMFTLLDALILRPVPFRAPDELSFIYMGTKNGGRGTVAPAVLRAWRDSPAFAAAESASPDIALIETNATVATRVIARVSPGIFDLLGGVRPVRGRLFDSSEGRPGTDDRILLSEDLWRSLYHSDPSIVGRRVTINSEALLVVGILPSEFRFPRWNTEIWRAIDFTAPMTQASAFPMVYVRFAARMPRADALRLAQDAARAADARNAKLEPQVRPLAADVLDPYYQRAVPFLAGGVMLVFLVLCANVSSLLLARLTERRREFSMRSALGATRARVMRQAFVESGIIGALGVVAGIALAWALISAARGLLPDALLLRTLNPLNIDLRALGIASASGVVAVLATGLLPAWIGTHVDPIHSLRVSERGGTDTRGAQAVTRGLLVAEIALACTLLVGATLLVRSFVNLASADRGLDASGVVIAWIGFDRPVFNDPAARLLAVRSVEDRIRQLPGVHQMAWSGGKPPGGGRISWGDWTSDVPGAPAVDMMIEIYEAGPEFFELYGIPLVLGRSFQPADTAQDVLVGQRLAKVLWPDVNPVGRSFSFQEEHFNVIGVVREIHHPSLDPKVDRPEFYMPFSGIRGQGWINIRCRGTCPDTASVRQQIRAAHPELNVYDADALEDLYFEQLAQPRAVAALGFTFAAIAVLAAAAGLFSVLTYAVGRRKREFGIRSALGASPAQIQALVMRDGVVVALAGVAIGSVAAWSLARAIASFQYGVSLNDPGTWLVVLGVITITTLAASWRPARSATRVSPVLLLKDE
jgi:putative ABC transport system permease protein